MSGIAVIVITVQVMLIVGLINGNLFRPSNPFSNPMGERQRGVMERMEDDYQIPSSNLCLSQAPISISVPSRHSENGSPEPSIDEKPLEPGGHSESVRGLVSRVAHTALCPFNTSKIPSDYDILLPPQALEVAPSQPPPPPARHSFTDLSSSSPSSSCNSSTCSSSVSARPHRPPSGHEHLLLTPSTVFDILNNAAPLPPVRRHAEHDKGSRGCLEYDHQGTETLILVFITSRLDCCIGPYETA
ncbi:E3 ubiquitin-protein ligase CBL-B-like isoform X2 [Pseudoliparis swirei]|uniref:E3 ubiquitin-protein ligase CBL-B-like isoform X2 n=1 Tax=Pseudoliparis swirei TaxID=2059687 RepID=UPI0024BE7942|nr:E3 ubiquitin-protein ligase CBL-B-like isoform X2 [Pseudoliparis swirei]